MDLSLVTEIRKLPNLCVTKPNVNAVHMDTSQMASQDADLSDKQVNNDDVTNVVNVDDVFCVLCLVFSVMPVI